LYFPGIWSEGISGGQGLMAVALVIFARWSPLRCMAAALLFGGAQALGPSLQALGHGGYYHLFNASPYLLTLVLMVATCSRHGKISGAPGALGRNA
jgi:simple sugar transport system permease protein